MEHIGGKEDAEIYGMNPEEYNMSDEDYENLQRQLASKDELDDEMFQDMADDWLAEPWIGKEYPDLSDGDLYRGV